MSKLTNDISRMKYYLRIIEQFNNFRQLDANEEIIFLKDKIDNLYNIKDTQQLIEEFKWCANMVNLFYNEIDPDFKLQALREEELRIIN